MQVCKYVIMFICSYARVHVCMFECMPICKYSRNYVHKFAIMPLYKQYVTMQLCKNVNRQVCKISSTEVCKFANKYASIQLGKSLFPIWDLLYETLYKLVLKPSISCKKIVTFRDYSATRNFFFNSSLINQRAVLNLHGLVPASSSSHI